MDARLAAWIHVVDFYWQRAGVSSKERERRGTALRRALDSALARGASVDELISVDPRRFAHRFAPRAAPLRLWSLRPRRPGAPVLTALLGAAIGGLLALAAWYPPGLALMSRLPLSPDQQTAFVLGLHAGAVGIVAASVSIALQWRARLNGLIHPLAAFTGLVVLSGAALGVLPAAVSSAGGYGLHEPVLFSQAASVLALGAAGLLLVRGLLARADARHGDGAIGQH